MKRILIIVLILQLVSLVGCRTTDETSQPLDIDERVTTIKVDEEETTSTIEEDSIYEKLDKLYDLSDKDEVIVRKINEEKLLIGFQDKFEYQMNPIFYIYDLSNDESIPVNGQLEFIDEIRIENNQIEFFSKGTNIMNGFKKFPNITLVDIKTGYIETKNTYSRLGSDYKPYYLGNSMNETKLDTLEVIDQKILFDFSVSENSILAGGDHCPNIEIISEDMNKISVDIENLVINEEMTEAMVNEKFIDIENISSYIDGRGINHSVLNFQIKDFTEYTCSFETGNDGIRDLIIGFK